MVSLNLNLVLNPWIPVRRRSGKQERIAPWQVAEREDPAVALVSPRADFDGALAQFLVGLLQTGWPPESTRRWRLAFETPPSPEALRADLEPLAASFGLLGNGPRFLQDLTLESEEPNLLPVNKLFVDLGSESLFVDSALIERLCLPCAAAALLTLQGCAPSGGRGHRTSLRGGGPLTTLVVAEGAGHDLWHSFWLNVLDAEAFRVRAGCTPELEGPQHVFPWLAPTRTSEAKTGTATGPQDIHPHQLFWAMPRRIRLRASAEELVSACSLCNESPAPVEEYATRNLGVSYEGDFEHPLSPHREDKDGHLFPIKGSARGLSYRQWLGLAVSHEAERRRAAAVVDALNQGESRGERAERAGGARLWAFGYQMDNMKARAWCEGRMPLLLAGSETQRRRLTDQAAMLIEAATQAQRVVYHAVKALIHRRPQDLRGEPTAAEVGFWQETEAPFYALLPVLRAALEDGGETEPLMRRWHGVLVDAAEAVFARFAAGESFRGVDPAQQARAWNNMRKNLFGKKIRGRLGLSSRRETAKAAGNAAGGKET